MSIKKRRFDTIVGLRQAAVKKFAIYEFGQDYILSVKKNRDSLRYDIYVLDNIDGKKIDQTRVEKWNNYWGKHYAVIVIPKDICSKINDN